MKHEIVRAKGSRSVTEIDVIVGENLRRFRLANGYTLTEFGQMLGMSHQQVQKYETGVNRLSAGVLWQAADALGVSVEALFVSVALPSLHAPSLPPAVRKRLEAAQAAIAEALAEG